MKAAVLVSGGTDSYIMWNFIQSMKKLLYRDFTEIDPVYINYGGRYCLKEQTICEELFDGLVVLKGYFNFDRIEQREKAYIPNRNLYLISLAAGVGYDTIFLGGLKDDNVGDKCAEFYTALERTLKISLGNDVKINAPFQNMSKIQIIQWFMDQYANVTNPAELLRETTSCYDAESHYCGECEACFRKACAFFACGIDLPFYNKDMAEAYHCKARQEAYDCEVRQTVWSRAERNQSITSYVRHLRKEANGDPNRILQ